MIEPTILYEDVEVLVINKPAGLVVHPSSRAKAHYGAGSEGLNRTKSTVDQTSQSEVLGKTEEKTLVDWILKKYPETKDVGEPGKTANGETILRSGIVHRLDRETSGVMLVAKTQESFLNLKNQFKQHEIKKVYQAFVLGEMKNDEGVIDRPISRSSKDFRMWTAQRGGRGKEREAITEYKVLNRKDGFSFIEIYPKTGRTHQIRVHFKAINYPLVSDKLYGREVENNLGFKRLALHSKQVTFKAINGEERVFSAPYPEDFERAMTWLQSS